MAPESPTPQNVVTSYYFSDVEGNVVALMSPSGMELAQYKYDPFGNMISMSGLMAGINKYRFSSKEWEGNAGLYYYGYRFYDPYLQRWPNRDPIQESGGLNLFEFIDNNPMNSEDSDGLAPPKPPGKSPQPPPVPRPHPPAPVPMPISTTTFTNLPAWPIIIDTSNLVSHCDYNFPRRNAPPVNIWWGPIVGGPVTIGGGVGGTF